MNYGSLCRGIVWAGCLAGWTAWAATTYYVDGTSGNDGNPGTSLGAAKKTIQAAVNLCEAGDTVLVNDGVYTDSVEVEVKDTSASDAMKPTHTVVHITKKITLRSINGKEKTHIVGRWGSGADGLGAGACRGILVTAGSDTKVKGFTIRDCATTGTKSAVNDAYSNGGAISTRGGRTLVVDCTIDNCRAGQGGASDNDARFFRCLITRCRATGTIQAFYRGKYIANSIIADCGNYSASGTILPNVQTMEAFNCTFLANNCSVAGPNGEKGGNPVLYNCAVLDNAYCATSGGVQQQITAFNCVDSRTDGRIHETGADGNCVSGVSRFQYFSPGTGDWRLVSGSALKDAGNDDYVDGHGAFEIPAEYRTDYFGRPRKVGNKVDIGAVELQADETQPDVAAQQMRGRGDVTVTVGGVTAAPNFWCAVTARGPVRVATATPEKEVFCYSLTHNGDNAFYYSRFPDGAADQGFWYSPPTAGTSEIALTPSAGSTWARADYAGDDSDGTEAKPYRTIQEAFDAAPVNGVVHVLPGTYDTGTATGKAKEGQNDADGATCRLSLWKNTAVRSTDGAARTVIKGGDDVTTIVRPSRYTRITQLQGFTLTGQTGTGGGAFHAQAHGETPQSVNVHVTDCVISNNISTNSAAIGGWLERCLLRDNFTTLENMEKRTNGNRGTQAFGSILSGCVIDYSPEWFADDSKPRVCTSALQICWLFNCTLNVPQKDGIDQIYRPYNTANGTTRAFNNASRQGTFDNRGTTVLAGGNVQTPGGGNSDWMTGLPEGAFFADIDAQDYRPLPGAAGLDAGAAVPDTHVRYETGDFNGLALHVDSAGAPWPGAFQRTVRMLNVPADARGTVTPSGQITLGDGASVTVTAAGDGVHQFLGWIVNGETNLTVETAYTYTLTADVEEPSLAPLYSRVIYVDAADGDDARDGLTAATAKRTLAHVTAKAAAGDVIYAAEGDYRDGTVAIDGDEYEAMTYGTYGRGIYAHGPDNAGALPPCRAFLRAGVTLVATGAKERTFITGARDAAGEDWDGHHWENVGPNAVRCLAALPGARVEGFTIRNGATRGVSGGPHDVNGGGCVLAPTWVAAQGDSSTAVFVNCDIDNGVARSGGNALGGVYYKCRFLRGASFSGAGASAGYSTRLIQCLVYRSGSNDGILMTHHGVINSVIYNHYKDNPGASTDMQGATADFGMENSVLYVGGSTTATPYTLRSVKNCVIYLRRPNATNLLFDEATCTGNVFVDTWDETGVDPQTGELSAGSPAIDLGDAARLAAASAEDAETDLAGGQRVYNGAIDAGCREFDWRGAYAAALGVKNAAVPEASASVRLAETGALTLDAAGALAATWTAGPEAKITLPVRVTGAGTLTVTVNGAAHTYTAADGAAELAFKVARGSVNTLRAEWAPAGAGGTASFGPMTVNASFIIILR